MPGSANTQRTPRSKQRDPARVGVLIAVGIATVLWWAASACIPPDAAEARRIYCTKSHHPKGCVQLDAVRPKGKHQQPSRESPDADHMVNGGGVGGGPGDHRATAVAWAKSQSRLSRWAWYCERFVEEAFGERSKFASALAAQHALRLHGGAPKAAPAGTLLFFGPDSANRGYGHVGISIGRGKMISALSRVVVTDVAGSAYWRRLYRGWSPAPPTWRGRIPLPPGPTLEDASHGLRITSPAANQTLGGTVNLQATATGASGVDFYAYYATTPDPSTREWHALGPARRDGASWVLPWDTTKVPDQDSPTSGTINVVAVLRDDVGEQTGTRDFRRFGIANPAPAPAPAPQPAPSQGTADPTPTPTRSGQQQNAYAYAYWSQSDWSAITDLDQDVSVEQSAPTTFWAGTWAWQGRSDGGFVGLQQGAPGAFGVSGDIAIFSVFGAIGQQGEHCGEVGESARSCRVAFPFVRGRLYRLSLVRGSRTATGTWWSGSVVDTATETETPIGSLLAPAGADFVGSYRNFTEYFGAAVPSIADVPRSIAFYTLPAANKLGPGTYTYNGPFQQGLVGSGTSGSVVSALSGSFQGALVTMGGAG